MSAKNEFKTAVELRAFIDKAFPNPGEIYVKEVYNLGNAQYSDSPLFIYSGYSIIMVYLYDDKIALSTYDKDFFIQHIRGGIFRENSDSDEFYYFSFPHAKLINSFVQNIEVKESEEGSIEEIKLIFKNGQELNIGHSDSVIGTMRSSLAD